MVGNSENENDISSEDKPVVMHNTDNTNNEDGDVISNPFGKLFEKNEDEDDNYEKICYVCRRPESKAGKMISMPGGMNVCHDCMQKSFDSMNSSPFGMGGLDLDSLGLGDLLKSPNVRIITNGNFQNDAIPKSQKLKKKKEDSKPAIDIDKIPAPHIIKGKLDEYVIGQDYAKKVMAVAVYNHYKRVANSEKEDVVIEKSNMLMIGPTGSGKTYLVKTLAELLDVPLAIADATSLTEAGYIGDDIESVVSKLLAAADNDVEKAETGIIFIDEIDKLAKKQNAHSRDVSGESVQQGLLKLLEGSKVEVPVGANSKNAMVPLTTIDTKNILFICGGAFPGLDDVIKERLNKEASIGFKADLKDKYDDEENIAKYVILEDLRKFGMIPEFLGRLPIVFTLDALSKEMLMEILNEPKNAIIKQYQKLLEYDEVQLEFDQGALEAIAEKALEKKTGARALRSIIEEFMLDIMYEIPKDDNIGRVTITRDYIEKTGGPVIEMRSETPHDYHLQMNATNS
ncbi:MAG: ATP-dependent Clp protease ATP-binding subunit ClpX [Lachnospiraceae bacterium]|nr:ATP-dependent Clp protease ATP-binding subunit ClpX [Lachnospiraceae bacterium]